MGQVPTLCGREETCGLDDPFLCSLLKYSKSLLNLDVLVGHTSVSKHSELVDLIKTYAFLFGKALVTGEN